MTTPANDPPRGRRITADELAELHALQQAINDDQQKIAQMQEALTKRIGAFEYVANRLKDAYHLNPQDSIDADGVIHRATEQ